MLSEKELALIKNKIPELGIEQHDGAWTWTFRDTESAARSDGYFDTYIEALVDFIATRIEEKDRICN